MKSAAVGASCLVGLIVSSAAADQIYWAARDTHAIKRANLDGTGVEVVVNLGSDTPWGLALDPHGRKVYWAQTNPFPGRIQRANLDGTNVETIFTDPNNLNEFGLAIDVTGGKLYWTSLVTNIQKPTPSVRRANLDGTDVEALVTDLPNPSGWGITLDLVGQKMYFGTGLVQGSLYRANLDGSGLQQLIFDTGSSAVGVAVHSGTAKAYWVVEGPMNEGLFRANLTGTSINTFNSNTCRGVALDVTAGKLYWTDTTFIHRSNLDGSNVENTILHNENARGLALCPARYGDLAPPLGIDVDDIDCGLRGFSNNADCPQADIEPCSGDGDIDVDDLLSALDAFSGTYACPHPCP